MDASAGARAEVTSGDAAVGDAPRPLRSVGELVRLAMAADVARLIASDPIARIGEDPEGVHQARVATRRLRSHLATFSPVLRHGASRQLSGELRWLGRSLGHARDLDVLAARFHRTVEAFDPMTREDGQVLLALMDAERAGAAQVLGSVMGSKRYAGLLSMLGSFVAAPRFRSSAGLPGEPFLIEAITARLDTLAATIAALSSTPPDTQLHEVRILAKPARYAAELGGPVLGDGCVRLARRLADLCDELGLLNDGARANLWLDEAGADPVRALAVARIRAVEIDSMTDARGEWPRRWERVQAAAAALGILEVDPPIPR